MELSNALSTLKAVAASKKPATLMAYLKEKNPELAKKTEETTQNLRNVMAALKRGKTDLSAQRKAAAMQKVAQIKAAIQALKMSGIVDPKMIAKMAAKLAKELAAAVKEYASAGGTTADVAGGDTTAPSASGEATATDSAAEESGGEQPPAEQEAQIPQILQAAQAQGSTAEATALEKSEQAFDMQRNPPGSVDAEKQTRSYEARQSDPSDSSKAQDTAFKKEVEEVIKELRKLIRQHKPLTKDNRTKTDWEEAEKSLKEAEKTLATLTAGSLGSILPASLTVTA